MYASVYVYIFIGYRLCRRPVKKSAGSDFWMAWPSWDAPCKPFETFGMHWADQGSQSRLFDTPVGAAAPVSGPGRGGGGLELRQPVAACGALWRISAAPLRWYKVGCLLQSAAQ